MENSNKKRENHTSHFTHHTPQKGITLIALIITVIVMLILVGVTINVALNGGLFTKAEYASEQMQIEAEKEELLSAVVAAIGTDGKVSIPYLDDNLPSGWSGTGGTYASSKGNTYTVDENGKITAGSGSNPEIDQPAETTLIAMYRAGENCTEENCTDEGHLHIGDYVSYNPNTTVTTYYPDGENEINIGANTGYTVAAGATELQVVEQEDLNWRVLGASGDNVLLISGAPTIISGIRFYGHIGYNNYENIVNAACSTLYSKSGIGTARSITMNDIDTYLDGNNFNKSTFNYLGIFYGDTKTNITSKFGYDSSTSTLTKLAEGTTTLTLTSDAYYYTAGDYITNPTKLDLLQGSNNYYYWVASRTVSIISGYAAWDANSVNSGYVYAYHAFCDSTGTENNIKLCLRPVVSITSNVTVEDVYKLETAPTETWDDPLGLY